MTVAKVHRLAMTLAVTIALSGMLQGTVRLALAAATTMVLVWIFAPRLHRPSPLALRVIVHASTVVLLGGALIVFGQERIDGVLMIVMLGVANRFVLRAGHRDDLIIIGAASVLIAAATTISPGLAFLLIALTYLPTAMWSLWAATLLASHPDVGRRPAPRQMRTIAGWSLALMMAGFLTVSLLPRYHFSRLLSPGYFMQLAGATRSMDLEVGGVRPPGGGAAVLQIEVQERAGPGVAEGLYARLFALNVFDGKTFTEGEGGRTTSLYSRWNRYDGGPLEFTADDGPQTVRVSMERIARIGQAHPVAAFGRTEPRYVMVRGLSTTESGNWISQSFPRKKAVAYKVDLGRKAEVVPRRPEVRAAQLARLRQLPDDLDPRIRQLAEGLVTETMTTDAKVAAMLRHFAVGYAYSLDPLEGESDNPLIRFLFEAKAGHCELYAGALAVLLRVVGVPARVVTGYYGGRWNDAGAYLEMSEDDAHAWVEIFHEDEGWQWVDATPADARARRKPEVFAWFSDFYKALDKLWYDKVVDFDEAKRRRLIGEVSEQLGELPLVDELTGGGPSGGGGRGGAVGFVLLLVPVAVGGWWSWRRRRRRPDVLGSRLRRMLDPEGDETSTLGQLLASVPAARRAAARRAVLTYEAWRFGPTPTPDGAGPVLEAIVQAERVKV